MLESAGGFYVPRQARDRLHHFFRFTKVQPYGPFEASIETGEAMEEGYRAMAGLSNCDPDELNLGLYTTMNFYVPAQAIRHLLKPGDEIVVTNQDHEANIDCWRRLSEFGVLGVEDTDEDVIRISLVHYNSVENVDRLVEGVENL